MIIFRHSMLMVKRNFRSYSLLSITIFISFTILFSFLAFVDSNTYNKNKEIFSVSPDVIMLYGGESDDDTITTRYNALINQMSKIKDTYYYQYYEQSVTLGQFDEMSVSIKYIPSNMSTFYIHGNTCFNKVFVQENNTFCLNKNEAIIEIGLYNKLKNLFKDEDMVLNIPVYDKQGISYYIQCKVVGTCERSKMTGASENSEEMPYQSSDIFISQETLKAGSISASNRNMLVYSPEVPRVLQMATNLGIGCNSQYIYQQEATEKIRATLKEKYVILLAIVIILGINLYGCMKNVLYDRYFEIGVKRAIGIKKCMIVVQFFIEGIIVMIVNLIMSLLLSGSLLLLYKLCMLKFKNEQWTIFISQYSIMSYGISCLLIMIIVCVLLAYQAVNFEIVKYLKEE